MRSLRVHGELSNVLRAGIRPGSILPTPRLEWAAAGGQRYGRVMPTRFNHMELTLPRGTLTAEYRAEIDAFYGPIFGWRGIDTPVMGQSCHLLLLDDRAGQFILLAESDTPLASPGYDHLGLLQDTRAEVDAILAACLQRQAEDD